MQWWKEGPKIGNSAWEVSTPPAWSGPPADLLEERILQDSYKEQKCFSTLLACVPVLLIEESLLLIPSSSLNHRIRKVGVRPLLGFCFFPILKAEMGCSSLINCASHHHQNLHGSPSAKSGELCSTPRKLPSPGLQTVRETLLSLHLCWAFPPNPKVMMQVLFSSWICLAGSDSYLSLFPLHFTCGFKCTVAKILFHTEETRQYF